MNTGGAGRASLGPIRAELRYISMFEWSWMLGGIGRPQETQEHMTEACYVLVCSVAGDINATCALQVLIEFLKCSD